MSKKSIQREAPDNAGTVRETAIGLLARRDYASGELRVKLEQRGHDESTAAAVVAELTDERILNDARYAGNYVTYHAARGQGPLRITTDLKALGVADDVIETAVAAGPDWRALAREVRVRKFGAQEPSGWPEKARQARFLQYRGFSSDHIRSALGADADLD
jgi:regulatory protein